MAVINRSNELVAQAMARIRKTQEEQENAMAMLQKVNEERKRRCWRTKESLYAKVQQIDTCSN